MSAAKAAAPPPSATPAPVVIEYEHRERCRKLAIIQIVLFSLSLIFTYEVFYFQLLGIITGILGVVGTQAPVVLRKIKYVSVYYNLNIAMLVVEIVSIVLWLFFVSSWTTWMYVSLIFGLLFHVGIIAITYLAMKAADQFRKEVARNPPQFCVV